MKEQRTVLQDLFYKTKFDFLTDSLQNFLDKMLYALSKKSFSGII